MSGTAIETYTGAMFDYADPQPYHVWLADVAHALSLTARFGGHIDHFYSVAQHAILVSGIVGKANPLHPRLPELQRAALHHDDHEAYVGDIPTPMKRAINGTLDSMVERIDDAIVRALDLDAELLKHPAVAAADVMALRIEATALKVNDGDTFAAAAGTLPAHSDLFDDHGTARIAEAEFIRIDDYLRRGGTIWVHD